VALCLIGPPGRVLCHVAHQEIGDRSLLPDISASHFESKSPSYPADEVTTVDGGASIIVRSFEIEDGLNNSQLR
jgi:hypothetical protein